MSPLLADFTCFASATVCNRMQTHNFELDKNYHRIVHIFQEFVYLLSQGPYMLYT